MHLKLWAKLAIIGLLYSAAITVGYTIILAGLYEGQYAVVHINRYGEAWLDYIFVAVTIFGGIFIVIDYIKMALDKEFHERTKTEDNQHERN